MESGVIDTASPTSGLPDLKLQLPLSCDPPGLHNPPKQLVWIVSDIYLRLANI